VRSLYAARSAFVLPFIAGNTKLLPRPQQPLRTPTNESCLAVCRSAWLGLPLMCGVHYFNASDFSAKSLSMATVRPAVGPAGTSAGRDGRRTPHSRARLASAILWLFTALSTAEVILGRPRGPQLGGRSARRPGRLNYIVFSLDALTTREDGWDRDAIVRGFSGCRDFAW